MLPSVRQFSSIGPRILYRLLRRQRWRGIEYNPNERVTRERIAGEMFDRRKNDEPLGTVARSRLLLDIIEDSFPTQALADAYFRNLDLMLKDMEPLQKPGQILLGLGSGRCGSTSLVAILQTIDRSCCTHENAPLISWTPEAEELQFHIRRFHILSHYFPIVADVSHWWLNVLDQFFTHFPSAKMIGLIRNVEANARSFMKIKGSGRGSYNHWVPYGNGIWAAAQWDPTYPTYAVPDNSVIDPDGAKSQLIERYVREYNNQLNALALKSPKRIMLVKTEDLNKATIQKTIFDFAGVCGRVGEVKLNFGTTADGRKLDLKY